MGKSLESLLSRRYLQVCPLPPEQQNNLNRVLMVWSVLLDPHCNCMKWIRSCLSTPHTSLPSLSPPRLQEAPHTVTALSPTMKDQRSQLRWTTQRQQKRSQHHRALVCQWIFVWGEWLNKFIAFFRIPFHEPNSVQTLCRKTWAQTDGGEHPAQRLND